MVGDVIYHREKECKGAPTIKLEDVVQSVQLMNSETKSVEEEKIDKK